MSDTSLVAAALARRPAFATRFWKKVDKSGECWLWNGARKPDGYGNVRVGNYVCNAYRIAFILTHGGIPDGLCLDHLCRNPSCVRPAHLEAVTMRENSLRGFSSGALAVRTGKCKRGHELVDFYVPKTGGRYCRVCRRVRYAEMRAARKVSA